MGRSRTCKVSLQEFDVTCYIPHLHWGKFLPILFWKKLLWCRTLNCITLSFTQKVLSLTLLKALFQHSSSSSSHSSFSHSALIFLSGTFFIDIINYFVLEILSFLSLNGYLINHLERIPICLESWGHDIWENVVFEKSEIGQIELKWQFYYILVSMQLHVALW